MGLDNIAVVTDEATRERLTFLTKQHGKKVRAWSIGASEAELLKTVTGAESIVLSLPIASVQAVIQQAAPNLTGDQIVIHTVCGVQVSDNELSFASQIIRSNSCIKKIGALACAAGMAELQEESPCGAVAASAYPEVRDAIKNAFATRSYMVFENTDLPGVELALAATPLYAMSIGIASGLGFGAGTRALVATRSLTEMGRLGAVLGALVETFSGLSALGGLFAAVAESERSGFEIGLKLAKGKKLDWKTEGAEARASLQALHAFSERRGLVLPLLSALHEIIVESKHPHKAAQTVLSQKVHHEQDLGLVSDAGDLPIPTLAPPGGKDKA